MVVEPIYYRFGRYFAYIVERKESGRVCRTECADIGKGLCKVARRNFAHAVYAESVDEAVERDAFALVYGIYKVFGLLLLEAFKLQQLFGREAVELRSILQPELFVQKFGSLF